MTEQNLTLDDMHDILAFRVIVKDVRDCYAVLGLVHAQWKPVPGRFKDYISMPKANGYQSLHTTVIGPEGERIEIQIRTEEMHRLAEHGVASHWLYKERHHAVSVKDAPEFEWLREIVNRQGQESDSKEFMHTLRMDLFKDEVYVFTPAGDVKELPEGATPLDFAFLIHTQVGSRCVGAKVNGKLVPLNTALKSGDTVEIITDKNRRPSRDWLKIVKTAKARSRIQQYLRTEERAAAMGLGREMLEKEARKAGINLSKAEKDGHLSTLVNSLAAGSVDELMASIGYARFTTKQVVKRLQAIVSPPEILETPDAVDTVVSHRKRKEQSPPPPPKTGGISVRGVDDMMVRIAHCCNPVPGDSIVGFISRGRGVIVHTATCPNIQEMEPDRLVSVQWDGHETQPFPVRIHIMARNQKGSLADIAIVLRDEDVNIDGCLLQALVDGRSEMEMVVQVRDVAHLYHVIDRLRHLPSVMEVLRRRRTRSSPWRFFSQPFSSFCSVSSFLLNVITLPANWIMLGLIGLWRFAYPSPGDMGVFFFAMLVGLALFGEVIEYIAQGWGSKKYGSSTSGMWAGLLGALVGALAGLPLLFGLGAFIGALVGAWIVFILWSATRGRNDYEARQAAKGALVGRFLGIVVKCGIGAVMLGLTCHAIFQVPVYPEVTTFRNRGGRKKLSIESFFLPRPPSLHLQKIFDFIESLFRVRACLEDLGSVKQMKRSLSR